MGEIVLKKDIVCVVPDERTRNYKWDKKYKEDNFINIELVSIDEIKKDLDNFCSKNGIDKSLIKIGAVLARHPYRPNTYMDFNTWRKSAASPSRRGPSVWTTPPPTAGPTR